MSSELRPNLIALNTIVYREVRRFTRIAADPAAAGHHHGPVLRDLR